MVAAGARAGGPRARAAAVVRYLELQQQLALDARIGFVVRKIVFGPLRLFARCVRFLFNDLPVLLNLKPDRGVP